MKNRYIYIVIFFLCDFFASVASVGCFAQQPPIDPNAIGYYADALRYGQPTSSFGTARIRSLGGASVSLGADASNLITNPAGLGLFTKSELGLSLGINNLNASSSYIGKNVSENSTFVTLPTLSGVFMVGGGDKKGSYKGGVVSVGFMRHKDFKTNFNYQANNSQSTIIDRFLERSDGVDTTTYLNEFRQDEITSLPSLAYASYLMLNYNDTNGKYYTEFRDINGNLVAPIEQREKIASQGGETSFSFAYAANFNHKLFIGFTLNIANVSYRLQRTYTERLTTVAQKNELQGFDLINGYKASGGGIGGVLGAIYQPSDFVRIGGSITIPSFYQITERDSNSVVARFNGFSQQERAALPSEFKYSYNTPWKMAGGVTFLIKKWGFFTLDAEYTLYNTMSVSSGVQNISADKATIKNLYQPVLNLKAGLELRYEVFRLRFGYALNPDPYKASVKSTLQDNTDRSVTSLSGGFGIRTQQFAFDFALINNRYNTSYTPYTLDTGRAYKVATTNSLTNFIITGTYFW